MYVYACSLWEFLLKLTENHWLYYNHFILQSAGFEIIQCSYLLLKHTILLTSGCVYFLLYLCHVVRCFPTGHYVKSSSSFSSRGLCTVTALSYCRPYLLWASYLVPPLGGLRIRLMVWFMFVFHWAPFTNSFSCTALNWGIITDTFWPLNDYNDFYLLGIWNYINPKLKS